MPAGAEPYDVIIRNARIIDGTGNPWYEGSIALTSTTIAAVGVIPEDASAVRTIDAAGRYAAPGFIDVHTHCEGDLNREPEAFNFIRMGVTSIITGNCGGSYVNVGDTLTSLSLRGLGLNVATLIGHNSVRSRVMGNARRDPSTTELVQMAELVDRAMEEGAVGLSTGLIYVPGLFSKTPEIIELAKAAARHNGVYATHMRSEGVDIFGALEEAFTIGREAGLPVQISHFKISAPKNFNRSDETIALVAAARAKGQDVTVDQYVYPASSTGLRTILPDWAVAGTTTEVRTRISDPELREKIVEEVIASRRAQGRSDLAYARVASFSADTSVQGMNIAEIAKKYRELDREPTMREQVETALDIITSGGAGMVFFSMDTRDVDRIAQYPFTMFASDSGIRRFGSGVPHPRGYGNNAKVIAEFVRDRKILSLEDAIRKMSSLPAQRFQFFDRGVLRPGLAADIVLFDLEKVNAPSTFEQPHAYAEGFDYVFVNGTAVIDDGTTTGLRPGRILYGPGWKGTPSDI